jgi:hypothetical protein
VSQSAAAWAPQWTSEGQERFDAAENSAQSIWPWDDLGFELAAIEFLTHLTIQTPARTPRACFWALAQVFGLDWGEACRIWIPGIEVKFSGQEIRAVLSVSPVTTDETTIGRIVAFGEAAWRFYAPAVDQPDIRRAFRTILIAAARKNRQFWIDRQATGRRIEISPSWFRVEIPEDVAKLRRAMKLTADEPVGSC